MNPPLINYMQTDNPFLDRSQDIRISEKGDLPHWHQNEKLQYVTFRLADSLPQSKIQELNDAIERFNASHPQPWDEPTKIQFHRIIGPIEARLLDNGYGECVLRNEGVRKILTNTIWFNHSKRYDVIAYVIMPNHVHMLILLRDENEIDDVMQAIKGFSAHSINKYLGRRGKLWMRENFDRIVRSQDHFEHCISYIRHNPDSLPQSDFGLYIHGAEL